MSPVPASPAAATAAVTGTRRPNRRSSTLHGRWCALTAWPPCPCERSRMPSTWSPSRSIPTSPPRTLSTTACSPTATWSWQNGSLTLRSPATARGALRAVAGIFLEFAAQDQARYQLLFLRTIPGYQPSPDSYALAVEVLASVRSTLARAGVRNEADFDLWTAVVVGLSRPATRQRPRRRPVHTPHRRCRHHVRRPHPRPELTPPRRVGVRWVPGRRRPTGVVR